jgi:hypothetical protein
MDGNVETGKQELHLLVDQLPTEQVAAALQYMRYLRIDPVVLSLLNAPADDEPYTEEQRMRDAEAVASIASGDGVSHAEMFRELGLQAPDHA